MFDVDKVHNKEKNFIRLMIDQNRLTHAIILAGEDVKGSFELAKETALEIISIGRSKTMDGQINRDIENEVDINIMDLAAGISVDDVRNLKKNINIKPHEGEYKIYIIAGCDKMTVQAQNALLKSLEEPCDNVVFILIVENKNNLLDTILSRATIINMEKMNEHICYDMLKDIYREKIPNDLIIRYCKCLDANLQLCKDGIDKLISQNENILLIIEEFILSLCNKNEYKAMSILARYEKDKPGITLFLDSFKVFIWRIFRSKLKGESIDNFFQQESDVNTVLESVSINDCIRIINKIDKAREYIKANANLNLVLIWLSSNLILNNA